MEFVSVDIISAICTHLDVRSSVFLSSSTKQWTVILTRIEIMCELHVEFVAFSTDPEINTSLYINPGNNVLFSEQKSIHLCIHHFKATPALLSKIVDSVTVAIVDECVMYYIHMSGVIRECTFHMEDGNIVYDIDTPEDTYAEVIDGKTNYSVVVAPFCSEGNRLLLESRELTNTVMNNIDGKITINYFTLKPGSVIISQLPLSAPSMFHDDEVETFYVAGLLGYWNDNSEVLCEGCGDRPKRQPFCLSRNGSTVLSSYYCSLECARS